MDKNIEERCREITKFVIETNATVRQAAKHFNISKSTVYEDVTRRISKVDPSAAIKARRVLDKNKKERSRRGGLSFRKKRQILKSK